MSAHATQLKFFEDLSRKPPVTGPDQIRRTVHLQGDGNNNKKMERMNEEIRDRKKFTRGTKKMDALVLQDYQLYHNYFVGNEGLEGKTLAENAGIKIEEQNKWVTVIQNATLIS